MSELTKGAESSGDNPAGGNGAGGAGGADATPPPSGAANGGGQGAAGGNGGSEGSSWRDSLSPEYRDDVSLKGYKSPNDLAKAYLHAQRLIGSDKVAIPGQKATDDDWNGVYQKLGRPDAPEKYNVPAKDGTPKEFVEGFKKAAHEAGLLPRQAEKVFGFYDKLVQDSKEQATVAREAAVKKNIDQLKQEWPDNLYDKHLGEAYQAMNKVFGKEVAEWADKSGAGNDATFIRMMHKVSQLVSEDQLKGEGGVSYGETKQGIQDRIDSHYADVNGPYLNPNHPGHMAAQKEVQGLFEMRNKK